MYIFIKLKDYCGCITQIHCRYKWETIIETREMECVSHPLKHVTGVYLLLFHTQKTPRPLNVKFLADPDSAKWYPYCSLQLLSNHQMQPWRLFPKIIMGITSKVLSMFLILPKAKWLSTSNNHFPQAKQKQLGLWFHSPSFDNICSVQWKIRLNGSTQLVK